MINVLLCLFILLIIIILCSKKSNNSYSIKSTQFFKGIMTLLVIMSHIFEKAYLYGPIAVSIFFFISSFGLKYKYNHGLKIKLIKLFELYLPFIFVNIFHILTNDIYHLPIIIISFISNTITNYSWYIFAIIFLYILFKFIYENEFKHKDFLISCIVLVLIPIMYLLGFGSWWFVSLIGFIVGIISYNIKDKNVKISFIFPFILLLIIIFVIYKNNLREGSLFGILMIICSLLASISLSLYIKKYESKNLIIEKIGKYSLTMYLFHPIIIDLICIKDEMISFIITIVLTYGLSQ